VLRVRGNCHCNACRVLVNVPKHTVTGWNLKQVDIIAGADTFVAFQHPDLTMKKVLCAQCGEVL